MAHDKSSTSKPEPTTKTIAGPDGSSISYPNLPNVGEQRQSPNGLIKESPEHHIIHTPSKDTASQISHESWRERVMGAARFAVERVGNYGHAAVQALVLDDWKALTNAQSSPLQRLEGGANLASWAIPEGKVAEIAGHALEKAAQAAAERLASSGLERSAEHIAAAGTMLRKWSDLTPNERLAGQRPWQDSTIWNRPLTDAERNGSFKTADDAKAFLGSATEKGGIVRDWHHKVENHTGKQFGPEAVNNVDNLAPIPRDPTHKAITTFFQKKDPDFGLTADGKEQSLRTFLKDKPWERHVYEGERALRRVDLDPQELRAETLERFEKRLELHDRLIERSQERGAAEITMPGVPTRSTALQSSETSRASQPRTWSPDMSHDDFAKLQAQVRGGSPAHDILHYEQDGRAAQLRAGRNFEGTIQSVEGDRIVQHLGRGSTATWSREELAGHFEDPKALDAMLKPGNYVNVGAGRNGVVDVQQRLPDHSWQSLGNQPLVHSLSHRQSIGR